jgi:hypothetical protein
MRAKSVAGFFARYFSSSSTALKSCVLVLGIVATSGLALAADQQSNPNPCNLAEADAAGMNGNSSTDIHAIYSYMSTAARLLKEEQFDELDCLADRARANKETFPGGLWKIHKLYQGLYSPIQYPVTHATSEDWDLQLRRLMRWEVARPKSVTARVALAWAYIDYAWEARGEGSSDTVSGNGWKLFADRTAEAKRILDEASTLPTKCPEWYAVMQSVAQNQDWGADRGRALYDEAIRFEPGYYYYARSLANDLRPKWHGEPGDTEKFVQEASDRIGGERGDIFYFQVATNLLCGCDDNPNLSLERIERGFEASEKLDGVSMVNLNLIAFLVSHYKESDAILADKTLTRIGDQWDEATWKKKEDFDRTKQWAAKWAPVTLQERAIRAEAEANMKTPDGIRYRPAFERKYRELAQECAHAPDASGKLEALISVGADGTVEKVGIYGPAGMCVYQKLRALQQTKTPVFPPPPQAPYWIKLDLDWSELAAVAAK